MSKCAICRSNQKDDIKYGEFLTKEDISVHTYCLYLTSKLCQRGEDEDGFFGFLPADIKKEAKRITRLYCCFCSKPYANIGCCQPRCYRSFHMICGVEHGALNQFTKLFKSYCVQHVRKINYRPAADETCCICYDSLKETPSAPFSSVNMLRAPCCRNGWFHKSCLQKFAVNAGYFFKCPLCNDNDTFRDRLSYQGIFIHNRDAAWELEPNAFSELLERPNACVAEKCRNRNGRQDNNENNPLMLCSTCGSVAIHKACMSELNDTFYCNDCEDALDSVHDSFDSVQAEECNEAEEEDVDVDVEDITDESEPEGDVEGKNKINLKLKMQTTITDTSPEEDDFIPLPTKRNRKCRVLDDNTDDSSVSEEDDINVACQIAKAQYLKMKKRRSLILSDGESTSEQQETTKATTTTTTTTECKAETQQIVNCDADDDDPLENFFAYITKRRSDNKVIQTEKQKPAEDVNQSEQESNRNETQTADTEHKLSAFDISCIAKRTRRKSQCASLANAKEIESTAQDEQRQWGSDVDDVAKRRRLKERQLSYEGNDSDTSSASSYSSTTSNSAENRQTNMFNVSCIANRTRKRKSMQNTLPVVIEEQQQQSSSGASSTSDESTGDATQTRGASLPTTTTTTATHKLSARVLLERLSCHNNHAPLTAAKSNRRRYLSANNIDGENAVATCSYNRDMYTCAAKMKCSPNFNPYITPKFTRIDGKLKIDNAAHNNFIRSYNYLVSGSSNENLTELQNAERRQQQQQHKQTHSNKCL